MLKTTTHVASICVATIFYMSLDNKLTQEKWVMKKLQSNIKGSHGRRRPELSQHQT